MTTRREEARLAVSRLATSLFIQRGFAGTTGDDIAAASGLTKRTIWRYFRSKEACVEPLLARSSLQFIEGLRRWPRDLSIEDYLLSLESDEENLSDYVLAAFLIALAQDEPALRGAWLMSCQLAEDDLVDVVRARAGPSADDLDIRLCTATIMAAIRVLHEEICTAAIRDQQVFTREEAVGRLAAAIRTAATLPICDPLPG